MLRSISSRLALLALVAGAMWGCDGERATQPSGKVAADGAVVVVTVQQDGAPVSGVVVELSRSIAGVAASYDWSATTDENGQARIEVTAGNGYYQARVVQDGNEVGHRSSIPLNAGAEVMLDFAIAPMMDMDDDALTRAYVMRAIERYEQEGLEATVAYYNSLASREDERWLRIIDTDTQVILASGSSLASGDTVGVKEAGDLSVASWQVGVKTTELGMGSVFQQWVEAATEEGYWVESLEFFPTPTQEVPNPRRDLFIRHGNLVFNSGHYILQENVAEITQSYVNRAIEYYEREGLEATVAYYNSEESLEGLFYLFLMDENDIYIAHPILPHLIGTDIKDVVGSDGQELGKEIAQATEAGIWVEYLWPHPISGFIQDKTTYAIRHDGLIFASGYYPLSDVPGPQPWLDADPQEYTVTYVENAIERYQHLGLDAMTTYYNSVASFEDQWYLFVIDANDIYVVHPIFPYFIGTKDIKDVVDSSGYELGKDIASATVEGHWVEYLWPHPRTLAEVPKVSYVVRHDGLIFASGYYPPVEDPAEYTQAYAQQAIERYEREGIEAVVAYYNSPLSVDRQWYLTLLDENGVVLTSALFPHLLSRNLLAQDILPGPGNEQFREDLANTTEAGHWLEVQLHVKLRLWAIRHDGYIFLTNYLPDQ